MKIVIFGFALLLIAVLLMGVQVFFTKKGEFPNTHIGASKAMQDRGIHCATSQDREWSRKESPVEQLLKSDKL